MADTKREMTADGDRKVELTGPKRMKVHNVQGYFQVEPVSRFVGAFPFFREPHEIGCFCLNSERQYLSNDSQLRYYVPVEPVSYDLREGYGSFQPKDESRKEYIDNLLKWIQGNADVFKLSGSEQNVSLNTDFVSWRGILTRLLCTPYDNRDGWKIAVTLFNQTYYICEFDTEEKIAERQHMTERHKEMSYWGYKFEQYVTADAPAGKPETSVPVNSNEEFCSVVRSRLDKHSLVYGGETDCCKINKDGKKKYIEMKTSKDIYNQRMDESFKRYKLIKWWAQSFLVGTESIVCGFRDDDGVVHRLETYPTLKIPKLVQGIRNSWDASVCFNFLNGFLKHIKNTVTIDDARSAYLFTWKPGQPVTGVQYPQDSEYKFLPEWYYEPLKKPAK